MEKIGVELTVEQKAAFISSMNDAALAVQKFGQMCSGISGQVSGFNQAIQNSITPIIELNKATANYVSSANNFKQAASGIETSLATLKSASSGASETLDKAGDIAKRVGSNSLHALVSGAGDAGKALVSLGGKAASGAVSGLSDVGKAALDVAGKVGDMTGKLLASGAKMAGGIAKGSLTAFKDFEAEISNSAAVIGLSGDELITFKEKASETALALGAELPVSASQAAEAITELAKAGFNQDQALDAARGTAILSKAANLDMGKAAGIAASTINQFGLKATDAGKVVDILAKSANASAVDVTDLAETFKYAGPVAAAAGVSIEDVAKATAVLGNAGIKGSSAGTGLKAILSQLASPSEKAQKAFNELGFSINDVNGNAKPLQGQLTELRGKFDNLSSAEQIDLAKQIVGVDHYSKLLAIMGTSEESFNAVSTAIDNASGSANDMAKEMTNNLAGAVDGMQGKLETLQIKVGKALEPLATMGANAIGKLAELAMPYADKFADLVKVGIDKAKEALAGFKAGIGGNLDFIDDKSLGKFSELKTTFVLLGDALSPLKTAFNDFQIYLNLSKDAANLANEGLAGVTGKAGEAHPIISGLATLVKDYLAPGLLAVAKFATDIYVNFGPLAEKAWEVYNAFSPLGIAFATFGGFFTGGVPGAVESFRGKLAEMGNILGIDLVGGFDTVMPKLADFATSVQTNATNAMAVFSDIARTKLLPAAKEAGDFIGGEFTKQFEAVKTTIETSVAPAMGKFGDFVQTSLQPKLTDLGTYAGGILKDQFTGFSDFMSGTLTPTIGGLVSTVLTDVIPTLTNWGSVLGTAVDKPLKEVSAFITSTVEPRLKDIGTAIRTEVLPAFHGVADFVNGNIMPTLKDLAGFVGDVLTLTFKNAGTIIAGVWDAIAIAIDTSWKIIKGIFDTIKLVLSGDLSGAFTKLKETIGVVFDGIKQQIQNAWDTVSGIFKNMISFLDEQLGGALTNLGTLAGKVWDGILTDIGKAVFGGRSKLDELLTFIGSIPGKALDALANFGSQMFDAGASAIKALANGIASIKIALPHFNVTMGSVEGPGGVSIPIPNISVGWYAKGGIFGKPMLAGIGEAGPEAVLPLDKIVPLFAEAMRMAMPTPMLQSGISQPATAGQIANYYSNSSSSVDNSRSNSVANSPVVNNYYMVVGGSGSVQQVSESTFSQYQTRWG